MLVYTAVVTKGEVSIKLVPKFLFANGKMNSMGIIGKREGCFIWTKCCGDLLSPLTSISLSPMYLSLYNHQPITATETVEEKCRGYWMFLGSKLKAVS